MARKVTHIVSPKPGQGATLDVPQDVKDEIDELYTYTREHPNEEGFVEFTGTEDEIKAEMSKWLSQVRSYCRTREAGALKFRQLPSKHLPYGQVRFQLSADLPENGNRESK